MQQKRHLYPALPSAGQWQVISMEFFQSLIRRLYARNKLFLVLPTSRMGYHVSKLIESVVYCLSKSLGEFGVRPTVFSFRITKCLTQNLIKGFVQIFASKIQDFFQTFSKTILYFSRLKVDKYMQVINRDLEKHRIQAFFMMNCKHMITTVQCRHKRIMKLLIL